MVTPVFERILGFFIAVYFKCYALVSVNKVFLKFRIMKTLTVTTRNLYTGGTEKSVYKNVRGFLDEFSIKNLYNQGLKVIDERIEYR